MGIEAFTKRAGRGQGQAVLGGCHQSRSSRMAPGESSFAHLDIPQVLGLARPGDRVLDRLTPVHTALRRDDGVFQAGDEARDPEPAIRLGLDRRWERPDLESRIPPS